MNSTFFSVKEAADRAGVSRQTMFRYIKDGKISATTDRQGLKQVELSELLRVFGELQQPKTPGVTVTDRPRLTRTSNATTQDNALIQVEFARLQAQLEIKTAELELAKERISELKAREHSAGEEKNRLLSLIERQSLLLAAPVKPPAAPRRQAKVSKPTQPAAVKATTPKTTRATVSKKTTSQAPAKKTAPKAAPKKTSRTPATTATTTKPAAKRRTR